MRSVQSFQVFPLNHSLYVVEKRGVRLTFAASDGGFINRNSIETYYQAAFRVRSSYTSSFHSLRTWPKPNLCPAPLCLRLSTWWRRCCSREHSDPKWYVGSPPHCKLRVIVLLEGEPSSGFVLWSNPDLSFFTTSPVCRALWYSWCCLIQ